MVSQTADKPPITTVDIASRIATTEFDDLPATTVERTKYLIRDFTGVAIAGQAAPHSDTVLEMARRQFASNDSHLFGSDERFSAAGAAMVNGITGHAWDLDDTYDRSPLHTSSSIVPCTVALAESVGADGRALILGTALGMDLQCRLGLACERSIIETGWHRTATLGTFGAAAGGARVLGLDEVGIRRAISLAYSQTAGSLQPSMARAYSKRVQPGHSAQAGVTAGLLARDGFPATRAPLEGDFGFFKVFERDAVDWEAVRKDDDRYLTDSISIKRFPCCRYMHSTVDAGLRLHHDRGIRLDDVASAHVAVSRSTYDATCVPASGVYHPKSPIDLQFNVPYGLLCAIDRGDFFIEDVVKSALNRSDLIGALPKVETEVDEELSRPGGELSPIHVTVEMTGGDTESITVGVPRGHSEDPMPPDESEEKFRRCVAYGSSEWSTESAGAFSDAIDNLESIDDVRSLFSQ